MYLCKPKIAKIKHPCVYKTDGVIVVGWQEQRNGSTSNSEDHCKLVPLDIPNDKS